MNAENHLPALLRDLAALREREAEVLESAADAMAERIEATDDEPTSWRERVWTVPAQTRLDLEAVAEVLDVSTRQVRRYVKGQTDDPRLPATRGPAGIRVKAGDLRRWIEDAERAAEFRAVS